MIRATVGVLLWVLALVVWFVSALPYGGRSEFMKELLYCASLLLPLWALSGLIPPMGKGYATWRVATAVVAVLGLLWVCAFLSGPLASKV